jgi:hypothetical protein
MIQFIIENKKEITFVVILLMIICISLLKYSSSKEKIIWFPKHLLPKRKEDANFSDDVLIYDYKTKKSNIGYYDYQEEVWRTINYQNLPEDFKWRNLEIDID